MELRVFRSFNKIWAARLLTLAIPIIVTSLFFLPNTVKIYYFIVTPIYIISFISSLIITMHELGKAIELRTAKQWLITVAVIGIYGLLCFSMFMFGVITHGGG